MKKLLIMASLFPPQKLGGGPITSISNLVGNLKDKYDIYVISHNFDLGKKEPLDGVVRGEWNSKYGVKVFYFDYENNRFGNILKMIKEVKPDVIYQNSFFSHDHLLPVLFYKKHTDKNVRLIVAPRGEFGVEKFKIGGHKKKIYKNFLKTFGFLKNVVWQATSKSEKEEIVEFIGKGDIFMATNLPSKYSDPDFKKDKKEGELSLFTISRIHEIKNIKVSLQSLKTVKGDVKFDIYGPIEQIAYWEECQKIISELPDNIYVRYMGAIDHSEVERVVREHDVLLFPTRGENFGQTIVDSFLNARPAIISDMTPWNDCVDYYAGGVIPLNDLSGFSVAIQTFVDMGQAEFEKYSFGAKKYIDAKLNISAEVERYSIMIDGNE